MNKKLKSVLLAVGMSFGLSTSAIAGTVTFGAEEASFAGFDITTAARGVDCQDLLRRCMAGDPDACDTYIDNWCRVY